MAQYTTLPQSDRYGNTQVGLGDGPNVDAFSRLRVSTPVTVFDQAMEFGIAQLFWNTTTAGVSSGVAHSPNQSNVIMTCGTGATDYCARQTFEYMHYRPGKSHMVLTTATFGAAAANVVRRMGYFDPQNGIFIEQNGTTDVAIVKRSYTTGSVVDTRVVQADWNLDRMDGTGPSGITLDLSKGQILVIDLQWLGYGRVRVGFDIDGKIIYAHQFLHANAITGPYMTTANLPVRFEIRNTGVQGGTHTMLQGCSSVTCEDASEAEKGIFYSANNGITPIAVTTRRAILSIRPKATIGPSSKVNRVPVTLEHAALRVTTNDCLWEIVYNPTFTGTPTWSDPNSQVACEYSVHGDAAAGAFTNGLVIESGYASSGQGVFSAVVAGEILNKLPIALDTNGANPMAMSLVITSMTGTSNVAGALCWKEIR